MKRFLVFTAILLASVHVSAQITLFSESFDTILHVTNGGANSWFLNSTFPNGSPSCTSPSQAYRDTVPPGPAISTWSGFQTNSFDCSGLNYVSFQFNHICKIPAIQRATIEVSIDGGFTWTQLSNTHYKTNFYRPNSSPFFGVGGKNYFSSAAYPTAWFPTQPIRIPDSTWWKNEVFDISSIAANQSNVILRFKLTNWDGNGSNTRDYGWLIDDIQVVGELYPPPEIQLVSTNANTDTLGPFTFTVNIPSTGTNCCNSVAFYYSINGSPYMVTSMTNTGSSLWTCTIPAANFLDTICYYFQASNWGALSGYFPPHFMEYDSPGEPFVTPEATDCFTVYSSQVCPGCLPEFYYTQDTLNRYTYTFYDTTGYPAIPDSDEWKINGVSFGGGGSLTLTLNPDTSYEVCRTAYVPGCNSYCSTSCMIIHTPAQPGISINYFAADSLSVLCFTPQTIQMHLFGSLPGYAIGDSIGVHINYDDGVDSSFFFVTTVPYFYPLLRHIYMNAGTYRPRVIVYSPDSLFTDTAILSPIYLTDTCGTVSGHVFLDKNQNCVYDATDLTLENRFVTITSSNGFYSSVLTNTNGQYFFNVPVGTTYSILVDTNANFYSSAFNALCPANGVLITSAVPSVNNNFFLACPGGFDLNAHITANNFVPGRSTQICVYPINDRCSNPSGQLTLVLDPLLSAWPDPAGFYSIHGDTITWDLHDTLYPGYFASLCVFVTTSSTAIIGDSVCVHFILSPVLGDMNPANNVLDTCWVIRASVDPNDKIAMPEGSGVNHAIRPETPLTYTIRFQNTGTASAQDVFILDTVDAGFNMNSLEVLAASHPMVPAVLNGNILRFTFDAINLPDSNENEPLSHGYVMYRITPSASLANGAVLHNTAGIYFDYNPAVVTNTTFHTIDFTLSTRQPEVRNNLMAVYPNPANDHLFVKLSKPGMTELNIYDITGRNVMHRKMTESGNIDVKVLPAGSYKIQVLREEGIQNASFLIVRQ